MLLNQVQQFNNLSPELRKKLEERVKGFGKRVRYKFEISNPNPDPTKYNGSVVWPNIYTLNPTQFTLTDPYEKREGVSKSKRIGMILETDLEKGHPTKFKKIRIESKYMGVLKLELEDNEEHFHTAMLLELHPKTKNGMFPDKTKHQVISRIDETALATEQRGLRSAKFKAQAVAQKMSDKEIVDFCDAMVWDSTEEPLLLRNKVEELAENNPVFFNDLVEGKSLEYQAVVKQALDRQIISFDPAEWKFIWSSNNQTIAILREVDGKNNVEQLAEWFQVNGTKADEVYKKMKALIK